jgi:transglutaminase-like putative cysteine protease
VAEDNYVPPETLLQDNITYAVNWDGTYTYEEAITVRLNTANAVQEYGQASIYYAGSQDNITILNAYSITPSGQRTDVLPAQFLDMPASDGNNFVFSNGGVKVIIFPHLSPGAIEHYHYILPVTGTYLPGQFFVEQNFPVTNATQSANVTVTAPAVTKLYFQAENMQGGPVPDTELGESKWLYTLRNVPAQPPEDGSVSVNDFSPGLVITSFSDYPSIGAAYEAGAADKAAVTPNIQELADTITRGIADPLLQARALYNWVSGNIRYVAVDLNYGGYVPDSADDVVAAGYGDCKDHVTLLRALLAAKKISSTGVLVNADNEFDAPRVAMPFFDHIITYVPKFNVYLDSTVGLAPFGVLPPLELGKTALITGAPNIPSHLITLPFTKTVPSEASAITQEVLNADGTITGTTEVHDGGQYELRAREEFSQIQPGMQAQYASLLMESYNELGGGTVAAVTDPRDLTRSFTFKTQFSLPFYASLPGPGTMPIPTGVPLDLAAFPHIAGLPSRTEPIPCLPQNIDEETFLHLPPNLSVKSLPKATRLTNAIGSYSSSYSLQAGIVHVQRRLLTHPSGPVCMPAAYALLRSLGFAVGQDFRAAISY